MNTLRWLIALVLLQSIALISGARAAAETESPAAVVQSLYTSATKHFGFEPGSIKANKPWLTPGLYARMMKKANEPVPKGDAPDIDGDLILDSQEMPDKWTVGKATIDHDKAKVEVTLIWGKEKQHHIVLMKQVDGAWKVDDIDYGKDGKMSDLLK